MKRDKNKNYDFYLVDYAVHGDDTGHLVALEKEKLPFDIRRVYYIYDTTPGITRGNHAHTTLRQILFCTSGSVKVTLESVEGRKEFILNRPNLGLYISGLVWRQMSEFSDGAVLTVLASEIYDENEYIRDYAEFKKRITE